MTQAQTQQGALTPKAHKDSVVVEDPPRHPIIMSADEADLSGIRLLDAASTARDNRANGERSD